MGCQVRIGTMCETTSGLFRIETAEVNKSLKTTRFMTFTSKSICTAAEVTASLAAA
jgi:hypothetical protein